MVESPYTIHDVSIKVDNDKLFKKAQNVALVGIDESVPVSFCNPKFGDYQSNAGMVLFKACKTELNSRGFKSPADIAKSIADNLDRDIFSNVETSPKGFINVTMSHQYISEKLKTAYRNNFSFPEPENKLYTIVDFSSPNVAKEMHVGHLRSTILGEAICRLLEYCGHTVDRVSHVGDWGTQFGMLIEYVKEVYTDIRKLEATASDLTVMYKAAKMRFDSDADFKKKAQLNVVALQGGDAFSREVWEMLCEISRKEFQKIYTRLNIGNLVEFGESFYNNLIPGVVEELENKNLLVESDGAKCFFVGDPSKRENEVPLMVVKSDGGYGYDSTDLAAAYYRLMVKKYQWVIYVIDIGQQDHIDNVVKGAEICGWVREGESKMTHIGFGLVQGSDGKKFRTRSGETVKLEALLDESVIRAKQELESRRSENADEETPAVSPSDMELKSECIGYAAIKYFDLKQQRQTNYRFSFDAMLDSKGNTAVYMLYAYARVCSIFRKVNYILTDEDVEKFTFTTSEERILGLHILRFYDLVFGLLSDLHVHKLAEYMYDLSTLFTTFYQKCRVIGNKEERQRLLLCDMTKKVLERCFYILGIQPLDRI